MTVAEKILRAKTDYDAVADASFLAGENKGYGTGKQDGISEGIEQGKKIGYEEGYTTGYNDGLLSVDGYSEGYEAGHSEGYSEGEADGISKERKRFWDGVQNYGKRTYYYYGFCGESWTDETFTPQYDLMVSNARSMFAQSKITDLEATLRAVGKKIVLDTNQLMSTFSTANFVIIGAVEFKQGKLLSNGNSAFYNCSLLQEIRFTLPMNSSFVLSNAFQNCTALREVRFGGNIGSNGLNLQWSNNLSYESLRSIIDCLDDKSSASGTWTVTVGSTNLAKLTEDDLIEINSKGWEFV